MLAKGGGGREQKRRHARAGQPSKNATPEAEGYEDSGLRACRRDLPIARAAFEQAMKATRRSLTLSSYCRLP